MSLAFLLRRVPVTATVTTSVLLALTSGLPSRGVDFEILTAMAAICQTQVDVELPKEAILKAIQEPYASLSL